MRCQPQLQGRTGPLHGPEPEWPAAGKSRKRSRPCQGYQCRRGQRRQGLWPVQCLWSHGSWDRLMPAPPPLPPQMPEAREKEWLFATVYPVCSPIRPALPRQQGRQMCQRCVPPRRCRAKLPGRTGRLPGRTGPLHGPEPERPAAGRPRSRPRQGLWGRPWPCLRGQRWQGLGRIRCPWWPGSRGRLVSAFPLPPPLRVQRPRAWRRGLWTVPRRTLRRRRSRPGRLWRRRLLPRVLRPGSRGRSCGPPGGRRGLQGREQLGQARDGRSCCRGGWDVRDDA